jgi:VWFA-related protein
LVFLDVTVLDKKGRPIVTGLTKDDFTVTEENQTRPIFSFEAPRAHVMGPNAGDANPEGKAPKTIFVLDLLNSSFEDFAFIRYSVQKYLAAEPARLRSPAEMLVIGNESLETLQGYTRSRADLLFALNHLPAALPYKKMNGAFFAERFGQSIDALQQIALQNKGVPGRKNVIWVGHGGPGLNTSFLTGPIVEDIDHYVHETTNVLVDARISLFVIYPGLKVRGTNTSVSAMDADADIGGDDGNPFSGDVNFGVFANETGGDLFYNRNDVDKEINRSEQLGSEYYTLTYQPRSVVPDGKFRRIRVTLRNPSLRAITKAGYFAPYENAPVDPRRQAIINVAEAARSTIPFDALELKVSGVVRHPDARTVEFTVALNTKDLDWNETGDGKSVADLTLIAASLTGAREIVASKIEKVTLSSGMNDPALRSNVVTRFSLTVRVPRRTQRVRVVMETNDDGRIGAADLDRKTIDAAPAMKTPEPGMESRRTEEDRPAISTEKF